MMPTHKIITLRVCLDGRREGGREEIESREEVAGNSQERRVRGGFESLNLWLIATCSNLPALQHFVLLK